MAEESVDVLIVGAGLSATLLRERSAQPAIARLPEPPNTA